MNIRFKSIAAGALGTMLLTMPINAAINTPATETDFLQRQKEVALPQYFEIFNEDLTPDQREALQFLYAYMPLPDITDYSGKFFLDNVKQTLRTREEMPWGKTVPDKEFRHFVLPLRVNNEMLDNARIEFYKELKDRVKDMSMEDAILEVNHWCHEKATYQPSDGRTHNPMATVYTARGRCGEESTFLVAALRAVGIPARQIYTPRWAHTDDNHAWVEAWANGKWYFLGACEPEAVLNLGWFNAPASRGMLMNARVFGNYDGDEEVLLRLKGYTDINTTEHYAPTGLVKVKVVDQNGNPVNGATVNYRLYNYAEYYPIVTKRTAEDGTSSLSTGLGDLIIWASDGTNFGIEKASVGKDNLLTIVLDKTPETKSIMEFDIVPPPVGAKAVNVTPEAAAENDRRKAYEDSIRGAYTATFLTPEQSRTLATKLGLDPERLQNIMFDARGNHAIVEEFLTQTPANRRQQALELLEVISMKDRSDVPLDVLTDHLSGQSTDNLSYILNPRVDNETLTSYRKFLAEQVSPDLAESYRANPAKLVDWVSQNIEIVPDWHPESVRMVPQSVWNARKTNKASRDIFFVALARSLSIPARIDIVTGKTQWADRSGQWIDADFDNVKKGEAIPQGSLKLNLTPTGRIDDPKYYSHFTISKIVDGVPQLLNYGEEDTWSSTFKDAAPMDEGQYMLTTGQRMADGSVLARSELFQILPGDLTELDLVMRQDNSGVQVIGNFNSENIYHDTATGTDKSLLSTTGRGYYIIGLLTPNHEPTNHTLRDIAVYNDEFEKWGRGMVLLFADENAAERFDATQLPKLPSTVTWGTDIDGKIASEIMEAMHLTSTDKPIFLIADTFNRVVFISQGYTIGLGEQLIDTIHKLKE